MKVALVHDYLTQRGGAERVFELLCQYFPGADVYTSLYDPERTIELGDRQVRTTLLQAMPNASKYFRLLAPFYYPAFRALDLQDYDLIVSSSTSFAKAVRKGTHAKHICFCHNVPRFLWDTQNYLREYRDFQAFYPAIDMVFKMLRKADLTYSQEPDLYIANSTTVARRIEKLYNRPAMTVNYPIDANMFHFSAEKGDFYLASARLLGYKRVDVIVEAFSRLGWPLVVSGEGPDRKRLEEMSAPNVRFVGYVSDAERASLLSRAKLVVVAALEDYGLVPVEANASGTPVVSYGAGGVLDTQIPGLTGLFFQEQTAASLEAALLEAVRVQWDYSSIRDHALSRFTKKVFFDRIGRVIDEFCDRRSMSLVR
ncbi:MAG: glycosyltransferase family 4 protein [Cyanobacteria bacterium J069]|nr:MAG: glycosyltransferase family 4 protein [Cyanobacteria bacterium J069]